MTLTWTYDGEGGWDVVNRGVFWPWNIIPLSDKGSATCTQITGKCWVEPGTESNLDTQDTNYNVVDTDYTSYAIVHNCDSILGGLMYRE